ncbi:MAG: hypothetical protein AVDCRST_MAG11-2205, partial [uncultured Gemmatimonadaceae bacterium]
GPAQPPRPIARRRGLQGRRARAPRPPARAADRHRAARAPREGRARRRAAPRRGAGAADRARPGRRGLRLLRLPRHRGRGDGDRRAHVRVRLVLPVARRPGRVARRVRLLRPDPRGPRVRLALLRALGRGRRLGGSL